MTNSVKSAPATPRVLARAGAAIAALLALAVVPAVGRAAAAKSADFRWSAAVRSPPVDEATLEAIVLDSSIFAATRPDLADLRLRNDQGQPVAFVVRGVPATKQRTVVKSWPALERGAKPVLPTGLEITFDPPRDQVGPIDGISVATPLKNFEQQVRVYASSDGQTWQPVSPPTVIFDYSRFVDARNVNVPIAQTSDRHFRLVIDDVTAEEASQLQELTRRFQGTKEVDRSDKTIVDRRPFRVDRITFYRNQAETETTGVQTARYSTTNFRSAQDLDRKQTVLEFDSRFEPISTVRLLTNETNFSRPASLEIPRADRGRDAWHSVATTTLLRLSLATLAKDDVVLRCPEQRVERWRVVVENGDSPPIAFSGVEVEGPKYQLIFLAVPGQSLTLDYGNAEASAPRYDTAAIAASLATGNLPARAELAEPVENAAVPAVRRNWAALLADRWVVGCLIAGLSIILAWGLYRAARRIDGRPPA